MKVEGGSGPRWLTGSNLRAGKVSLLEHLKQVFAVVPGRIELDRGRIKLDVSFLERRAINKELFQMKVTLDLKKSPPGLRQDELFDKLSDFVEVEMRGLLPQSKKAALELKPLKENDLSRVSFTINIHPSQDG